MEVARASSGAATARGYASVLFFCGGVVVSIVLRAAYAVVVARRAASRARDRTELANRIAMVEDEEEEEDPQQRNDEPRRVYVGMHARFC